MQGDSWDQFCCIWSRIGYNAYYDRNDAALQDMQDHGYLGGTWAEDYKEDYLGVMHS